MKQITRKRIKQINRISSDRLPMMLLNSIEFFWSLDRIIDNNVHYFQRQVNEYVSNKRWSQEIRNWMGEVGEGIRSDYLNQGYGTYLSSQLIDYLGFDKDDEFTFDIIHDYCMSEDQNKNIYQLKKLLIESALELDEMM